MAAPYTTAEASLSTNPGAAPVWVDLGQVRTATTSRGRSRELDKYQAGRATVVIENADRHLDPAYTAGAYYGQLLPMRPFRLRTTWAGVTYDLFRGFVDNWGQQYNSAKDAVAVVTATDGFKVLGGADLLSSAYAVEVKADTPTVWFRLGDTVASGVAVDTVGGVRRLSWVGAPTFGATSLSINDADTAVQFATRNDGLQGVFPEGTFPFNTTGTVEWMYRFGALGAANPPVINIVTLAGGTVSGVQVNVNDTSKNLDVVLANNTGTSFSVSSSGVNLEDGAAHHVAITFTASSAIKIWVDGVDRTGSAVNFTGTMANTTDKWIFAVNAIDYPPYVYTGGIATFDEVAIWTSSVSAARLLAHYQAMTTAWLGDTSGARVTRILDSVAWPAADRSIDTGQSILQSTNLGGTALTYLQTVEDSEAARFYMLPNGTVRFVQRSNTLKPASPSSATVFGDGAGEVAYTSIAYDYSDQLVRNDVAVTRAGGMTQRVGDTTSQTTYLRRSYTLGGLLYSTDLESLDRANHYLDAYKDPLLRITNMTLSPQSNDPATQFPVVLTLDLETRVTVRRRPQGLGAAIDQETVIEGIAHSIGPDSWSTTYQLSPADTKTYWIAGVAGYSEAGVTTRAGF
jgi:hypothetical protein